MLICRLSLPMKGWLGLVALTRQVQARLLAHNGITAGGLGLSDASTRNSLRNIYYYAQIQGLISGSKCNICFYRLYSNLECKYNVVEMLSLFTS